MKPSKEQVERHLIRNARAKKPRLESALVKLRRKISESPKDPRARAWEARCKEYEASLAAITNGSYPGANGKPFGATPGVTL